MTSYFSTSRADGGTPEPSLRGGAGKVESDGKLPWLPAVAEVSP
jgi:hypothetical protein